MVKHECDRKQQFLDVNFAALVMRTGREIGTHLIRDDPELFGLVPCKQPPIVRPAVDYASLKLVSDLAEARLRANTEKDPDKKKILLLLGEVGKIYLRRDRRLAVIQGTRARLDGDLANLDDLADDVIKYAQKKKEKEMIRTLGALKKSIDERKLMTIEEINELFLALTKALILTDKDIQTMGQQLSKAGILAPEEIKVLSTSVWASESDGTNLSTLADYIAPSVVIRQDGTVTTRKCMKSLVLQNDMSTKGTKSSLNIPKKAHEDAGQDEGGATRPKSSSKKFIQRGSADDMKTHTMETTTSAMSKSTAKSSPGDTKKIVSKILDDIISQRTQSQRTTVSARSYRLGVNATHDEQTYAMLQILQLLADIDEKNRKLTSNEIELIREFIESKATVPTEIVQASLNQAVKLKSITPKQADECYAKVVKEAKGARVISISYVRRLFEALMIKM